MILSVGIPRWLNSHTQVYLDGKPVDNVICADSIAGMVERHRTAADGTFILDNSGHDTQKELLFGRVSFLPKSSCIDLKRWWREYAELTREPG